MTEIFKRLAAPFPPEKISWRVGSTTKDKSRGLALAYIDARDVMERLDAVVGPANWQNDYPHANGKTVCRIGINVSAGLGVARSTDHPINPTTYIETIEKWVWKADGAGDSDVEAEKGALSDAFKRAAVRWGIGRYLYDLASPWVALEPAGNSYKIAQGEYSKLRALLIDKHLLLNDAEYAAALGIESYKAFYLRITEEERAALTDDHARLKTKALNNQKEQAA